MITLIIVVHLASGQVQQFTWPKKFLTAQECLATPAQLKMDISPGEVIEFVCGRGTQ